MNKLAAALILVFLASPVLAEEETLLGSDIESGGYGALVVKYGKIAGTDGWFVGGQGGWIINHALVIGGGGYGLANQIGVEGRCGEYLGFGYGGLLLEYIFASNRLVHFSVQSILGGGGIGYYSDEDYCCEDLGGDGFFALEPGANLILNLHKHVRVGVGGSYRYVSGVHYAGLTDSELSGAAVHFIMKFGTF